MPFPPRGSYPASRLRRNRRDDWSRRMVSEATFGVNDLIWPVFLRTNSAISSEIDSMPGVKRLTVDAIVDAAGMARDLGIPCIALFPATDPSLKTENGDEAWNEENLICRAVRAVKAAVPDVGVLCDVALDPYTSHGHDGVLEGNQITNDETIKALIKQSLVQVQAGCDVIAPSDMMDGRVGAIRTALDESGYQHVRIMSYAAKYSSAFYAPFREAIGSKIGNSSLDKRSYQMDAANSAEALREIAFDIDEGADMVMVKPGMPYLDVVRRVKDSFQIPTFAYQVSGEYAMIRGAIDRGWINDCAIMEALLGFKRAGADGVLTYFAVDAAKRLKLG